MSKSRNQQTAIELVHDMRVMLNDIAASATILGATPFPAGPTCKRLAEALHTTLLEFETDLAALNELEFKVKS